MCSPLATTSVAANVPWGTTLTACDAERLPDVAVRAYRPIADALTSPEPLTDSPADEPPYRSGSLLRTLSKRSTTLPRIVKVRPTYIAVSTGASTMRDGAPGSTLYRAVSGAAICGAQMATLAGPGTVPSCSCTATRPVESVIASTPLAKLPEIGSFSSIPDPLNSTRAPRPASTPMESRTSTTSAVGGLAETVSVTPKPLIKCSPGVPRGVRWAWVWWDRRRRR